MRAFYRVTRVPLAANPLVSDKRVTRLLRPLPTDGRQLDHPIKDDQTQRVSSSDQKWQDLPDT